jgi:hypothetical protein
MNAIPDRAEAALRAARRMAVPLPQLARELAVEGRSLAHHLAGDRRFVVVEPVAYPDLGPLPEPLRAAYVAALRSAGVEDAPAVVLVTPTPRGPGPLEAVETLLHRTVAAVLTRTPDPRLAAAAERTRRAVAAASEPPGRARSTTPLPDRRGPAPAPPPRRP